MAPGWLRGACLHIDPLPSSLTRARQQVDPADAQLHATLGGAARHLYEALLPTLPERSDVVAAMLEGRACVWAGRAFLQGPRLAFSAAEDLSPHLFAVPQPLRGARDVLALLGVRPGSVRAAQPCSACGTSPCVCLRCRIRCGAPGACWPGRASRPKPCHDQSVYLVGGRHGGASDLTACALPSPALRVESFLHVRQLSALNCRS